MVVLRAITAVLLPCGFCSGHVNFNIMLVGVVPDFVDRMVIIVMLSDVLCF